MLAKFVAVLGICIALPLAVLGQAAQQQKPEPATTISPQKQALIAELLAATNSKKNAEDIINVALEESEKGLPEIIWSGIADLPSTTELTNEERETLRAEIVSSSLRTSQRFRELLKERLDYSKLDEITALIYAKYYDESQLADLIAFYKSPTGQYTMEVMPKLFAESIARSQELMMPMIKDLMHDVTLEETQRFEKEVAAIIASHHRTQKKPTTNSKRRPN
ncbi:MAG TPA: DUF2059 domain-containing protein [Pyrinomonadaceae bacterium]|nr:DUF2059 domain-containing protein [Pyrinomonadaceae bacterium]